MRINNSTTISKKGAKEAFDFFWVLPHIVKPMKERPAEILGVFIEPIVRDVRIILRGKVNANSR